MIVGIIPAAGRALRMSGIPKFGLPVPNGTLLSNLCIEMMQAGAERIYVGVNAANAQIARQSAPAGVQYYFVQPRNETMSDTVIDARRLTGFEDTVLFGMPDMYSNTPETFQRLLIALREDQNADAVMAVWEIEPARRKDFGICTLDGNRVKRISDKAAYSTMPWGWGAMAWRSEVWNHFRRADPHIGFGVQSAIEMGCKVLAVQMPGYIWNCNTPEEYWQLCKFLVDGVHS